MIRHARIGTMVGRFVIPGSVAASSPVLERQQTNGWRIVEDPAKGRRSYEWKETANRQPIDIKDYLRVRGFVGARQGLDRHSTGGTGAWKSGPRLASAKCQCIWP